MVGQPELWQRKAFGDTQAVCSGVVSSSGWDPKDTRGKRVMSSDGLCHTITMGGIDGKGGLAVSLWVV